MTRLEDIKETSWRIEELRKISRSLHYLAEAACNYGLTPRQEKRQDRLEAQAKQYAKEIGGVKVYFQGDPRGCALYLVPAGLDDEVIDSTYSSYFAIY
jgi:hypothetical protein